MRNKNANRLVEMPKVEKGVPMPVVLHGALSNLLCTMEVGDSIFLKGRRSFSAGNAKVKQSHPLFNKVFSSRSVFEGGKHVGVRAWRTT